MISCILLAAGLSSRFGFPKALARLSGENIIGHIQKTLTASAIDEIIVVLGAEVDLIKSHLLNHSKVRFVYNKDYNLGQTSSIQCAVRQISKESRGMMLWPVDYPFIKTETVNLLMEVFKENPSVVLVPAYESRRGHPPIFAATLYQEILGLDHTQGVNSLYQKDPARVKTFAVDDPGILATFNTPIEFTELVERFCEK